MISLIKLVFSLVLILFLFACVSAQNGSKELTLADVAKTFLSDDDDDEVGRRKKRRGQFGYHIWWWGLKALSVLFTVKIKLVLLFLFLGGGIFYGLKVWQGTALGCPEPIIQEIKHHEGIIPYHSHFSSPDISYSAPPPDAYSGGYSGYSGYSDYSGGDTSGIYSNTPSSYPSQSPSAVYNPPTAGASVGTVDTSQSISGPANAYLPPTSRRRRVSGSARSTSDSTSAMFTDLFFRFLGVNTDSCKRRFVCELEFRNPFVGYAMNYLGNDLFSDFRLAKESPKTPKKFADCAKLYPDCEIPKEHTFGPKQRRRYFLKKRLNETITNDEEETTAVPSSD